LKPEVDKYAAMSDADKKLTIKAEASANAYIIRVLKLLAQYVHFLEKFEQRMNPPSGAMAGLYDC
jgi:hypothetical protein